MAGTRREALFRGEVRYQSARPCPQGHVGERQASDGGCVVCKAAYERRPEVRAQKSARAKAARARVNERRRILYADPAAGAARREKNRQWRSANWEHARAIEKESERKHRKKPSRKATSLAAQRARVARQLRQMPPWADRDAIKAVYSEAAALTAATGVQHHVDHVFPLKGRNSCGLHVAANLRVTTAAENIKKSNREPSHEQAMAMLRVAA